MYCKNCGNTLDELDNFCRVCGSKISGDEATFVNTEDAIDERREESFDLDSFFVFDEKKENVQKKIDEEYESLKSKIFNKRTIEDNQEESDIQYEENDDDDEDYEYLTKKSTGKRIFLLAGIVVFVIVSAVCIRYLLLEKGFISASNNVPATTQENEKTTDQAVQPNPVTTQAGVTEDKNIPAADKTKLIESLAYLNKNITEVKANDSLKYDPVKKYVINDITKSEPLTENLWIENEGTKYYYDESVVGTLISFNSQWIEYVNNSDKSVLQLTKEGSKAYKNIVDFNNHNIKEEFVLFEIGEIRKGQNGFYVWTHEKINVTKSGKTETKEYNWIYLLEPGEMDFKVVSYYKY